jgi:hypothetical protein
MNLSHAFTCCSAIFSARDYNTLTTYYPHFDFRARDTSRVSKIHHHMPSLVLVKDSMDTSLTIFFLFLFFVGKTKLFK